MNLRRLVLDTDQTNDALVDALDYLADCGIVVPDFAHRVQPLQAGRSSPPGSVEESASCGSGATRPAP